jgi:RNA polymerase sigma-70 factor (ECF subfamily)
MNAGSGLGSVAVGVSETSRVKSIEAVRKWPVQRVVRRPLSGIDPRATQQKLEGFVRDAAFGRPGAVEDALAVIRPIVEQYCHSRLPRCSQSYASVDDVVQEICLAALKALHEYVDRGASFLHLVRVIASNKVADAYRAGARDRSILMAEIPDRPVAGDGPEWHALLMESRQRLTKLLNCLPPVHQEILILRVADGFSAIETGVALGLTAGNVRTIQQRALARLRIMITREGGW